MKIALRIVRTSCMVSIGIFFISLPFRLPAPTGWAVAVALIVPGAIIIYVEAYLWWRLVHASLNR